MAPGRSGLPDLDPGTAAALAARVGLAFSAAQARQLAHFAHLLQKWNAVHSLTAHRSTAAIETHHLLDSLALVPVLQRLCDRPAGRLLDVGSGGGLPGIPIAIACPALRVTLLDANRKKCAFLTQARIELPLANVEVVHARVEQWRAPPFDVIVSRAVASLRDFVALTRHLLDDRGSWLAMKGPAVEQETGNLPPAIALSEVVPLEVPGLAAVRNVVVLRKRVGG
jgi:16S rRNA (guanine527-N7)-methyltransferase